MKFIFPLILIGTLMSSSLSVWSQNAPSEEQKTFSLSLVLVGERSDAYWVGDKEKMEAHAHQPDEELPKELHLLSGKGDRKPLRHTVRLNVASPRFEWAAATCHLATGKKRAYKKFASVPLPQLKGEYTVFLAQNIENQNWKEPQQLVMSDAVSDFPAGSVRIVNLSTLPIVIELGGETMEEAVEPGKTKVVEGVLSQTDAQTLTLWYTSEKGKKRPAFRRKLDFSSDQRMNITCAYSQKEGRPVSSQLFAVAPALSSHGK